MARGSRPDGRARRDHRPARRGWAGGFRRGQPSLRLPAHLAAHPCRDALRQSARRHPRVRARPVRPRHDTGVPHRRFRSARSARRAARLGVSRDRGCPTRRVACGRADRPAQVVARPLSARSRPGLVGRAAVGEDGHRPCARGGCTQHVRALTGRRAGARDHRARLPARGRATRGHRAPVERQPVRLLPPAAGCDRPRRRRADAPATTDLIDHCHCCSVPDCRRGELNQST